jgi:hypothetical protein
MALSYQINIVDPSHSHLSPNLLDNLSIKETPIPTPGPNSVLVRIRAVALNFRDLLCLADSPLYPTRTPPGLIPCSDGAGEIVSVGPGSTWKNSIGEAVILVANRDWIDGDVSVVSMENTLGAGEVNGLWRSTLWCRTRGLFVPRRICRLMRLLRFQLQRGPRSTC